MPVTLLPITRRRFLGSVAATALVPSFARAAETDPHRIALLTDPHIGEKPETISRDCNMHDRLKQVAGEVVKLDPKPAAVVIDGDLAYQTGTAAEYELFAKLVEPVREAGLPLHLGLGNHDHFGRFAEGLARLRPKDKPVEGKQVLAVELERATLVVLDSYDPKNTVGGLLGAAQLMWLVTALDARKDKPTIVFAHHPLQLEPDKGGRFNGIADSKELWPLLKDRPWVKAFVFGHTHTWRLTEKDGVHLINLPAIGYPFGKAVVTGWVDAHLTLTGIKLQVRSIDPKHATHGEKADLTWRKG